MGEKQKKRERTRDVFGFILELIWYLPAKALKKLLDL